MFMVAYRNTMRNAKPYVEPHIAAEEQRRERLRAEMKAWAERAERLKIESEKARIAEDLKKALAEWNAARAAKRAAARKAAKEEARQAAELRAAKAELVRPRAPRILPQWAAKIVHRVAGKHGLTFETVMGKSRSHRVVHARNEVFYRLKTAPSPTSGNFPSHAAIAEWFGREHTGIIFGAAKYAEQNGLPRVNNMDAEARVARNRIRTRKNALDRRMIEGSR